MRQDPIALLVSFGFVLGFAFLLVLGFVLVVRRWRRKIREEASLGGERTPGDEGSGFALAAYHGVIQRLKEQEQELERLRQAERERARASANLSEAVLSNLASGVLLFSPAGLVQQANPAARAILGYASPSGLHAREVFRGVVALRPEAGNASSGPAALLEAVEAALRQGASFRRLEADYQTPAGEARVLGLTLSPVRGAAGENLGATCLISDLTEISRLAHQMRLREQMAALGEMSAGIAHEFKNSLTTISGYAQMLQQEAPTGPAAEFAARLTAEAATLSRVVTDFLSVALAGDRTALRQVFSNLLRNSTQAARDGVPPAVQVSVEQAGQGTRIILQDNGRGIAPRDLDRIFLPFFTTREQGTGLGLALVHRIVSDLGGAVTAASEGAGAPFTLWLPAPKPDGEPADSR
jgi:signal transduction histidine kinase